MSDEMRKQRIMYESMEELVEAEANGWAVACIFEKAGPRSSSTYARLEGPYTRDKAKSRAKTLRKRAKGWSEERSDVTLLSVNVTPLWKDLK